MDIAFHFIVKPVRSPNRVHLIAMGILSENNLAIDSRFRSYYLKM